MDEPQLTKDKLQSLRERALRNSQWHLSQDGVLSHDGGPRSGNPVLTVREMSNGNWVPAFESRETLVFLQELFDDLIEILDLAEESL